MFSNQRFFTFSLKGTFSDQTQRTFRGQTQRRESKGETCWKGGSGEGEGEEGEGERQREDPQASQ